MKETLSKTRFIILNSWLSYVVVTSFLLSFTKWHWSLNLYSIINYDLWFLIFLLSFAIFKNTQYNRYIFLNISFLALFYALSFFHIFIGDNYLFGDNYLMYHILPYRKFAISLITCITIIYISNEYLFYPEKAIKKYLKTLLIVLPINIILYYNFLSNKDYILSGNHLSELFRCTFEINFLSLFFIGLYGYLFYKKEKPISQYVNAIIILFFFFIVYDTVDAIILYYRIDITFPTISYLILTFILLHFNILLYRKLKYTYSEFGKFYDSLIFSDRKINIRIIRRRDISLKIIEGIRRYLSILPNRFFFILLMIVSIGLFIFFFPKSYEIQIIIALILTMIIVFLYLNAFLKKRNQKNNF